MKLPMYNSLQAESDLMGLPIIAMQGLGIFSIFMYFILGKLVLIPTVLIYIILKIASRKDKKFLELYFSNIFNNYKTLGF